MGALVHAGAFWRTCCSRLPALGGMRVMAASTPTPAD